MKPSPGNYRQTTEQTLLRFAKSKRDSSMPGVIEVIMVLRGENGTAAFPGKSRNRDGFARSPGISGSFPLGSRLDSAWAPQRCRSDSMAPARCSLHSFRAPTVISTEQWPVMRPVAKLNEGKKYVDKIKPFKFLMTCHVKPRCFAERTITPLALILRNLGSHSI
jgi:hypothetical protein